jgi:hypothetical protein
MQRHQEGDTMNSMRASMLACSLLCGVLGFSTDALSGPHFVPNSQAFWDNSKQWTTEYGPAYRDTVEKVEDMVLCTGQYANCFDSGPEPYPCTLSKDGRFANCTCKIEEGNNYVLITAILNYDVYLDTKAVCDQAGVRCDLVANLAPVCRKIKEGKLIPGAAFISTFSSDAQSAISDALMTGPGTVCPRAPYAACMTASCKPAPQGAVVTECSCPVFWGAFQLAQSGAQCNLSDGEHKGDLVWSSSFSPRLLSP